MLSFSFRLILSVLGGAILPCLCFFGLSMLPKYRASYSESNSISMRQYAQVFLVVVASLVVWSTELNLQHGLGLPYINSAISYIILALSVFSFLFVPKSPSYDLVCALALFLSLLLLMFSLYCCR
jgi:hypothetical protein